MSRPEFLLRFRDRHILLGERTCLMGVLNITPDSFSDGGRFLDPVKALHQAQRLVREGADILDIGGESSRPGAKTISAKEEIQRILPVLKKIKKELTVPVSVDTYKTDVAHAALSEGAEIINDIYALRNNKSLARLIARHQAAIVLMHMRGRPATMQKNIVYKKDPVKEIIATLEAAVRRAFDAGISRSHIVIDPGFGFGKTTEQNLELLRRLSEFEIMGYPILVGLSRKSFIGTVLGGAPIRERLYGSLGAAAVAIQGGAHILRVHEVRPHRQLAAVCDGCEKIVAK